MIRIPADEDYPLNFRLSGILARSTWGVTRAVARADLDAGGYLHGAASKVFLEDGLMPRWPEFLVNLGQNLPFWLLIGFGLVPAWRQGGRKENRREAWPSLLLALPILTPLFCRNAFEYYYAFILPPAAILIG